MSKTITTQIHDIDIKVTYNEKWKPINLYIPDITIQTIREELVKKPQTTLLSFYNHLVQSVHTKHKDQQYWSIDTGRKAIIHLEGWLLKKILDCCLQQELLEQNNTMKSNTSITLEMLDWQNSSPNEWWSCLNHQLIQVKYIDQPTIPDHKWMAYIYKLENQQSICRRILTHSVNATSKEEIINKITKVISLHTNDSLWP